MKKQETPEQLLQRFSKRSAELSKRLKDLEPAHLEYLQLQDDLKRLEGSAQVAMYLARGVLPDDGNHKV